MCVLFQKIIIINIYQVEYSMTQGYNSGVNDEVRTHNTNKLALETSF